MIAPCRPGSPKPVETQPFEPGTRAAGRALPSWPNRAAKPAHAAKAYADWEEGGCSVTSFQTRYAHRAVAPSAPSWTAPPHCNASAETPAHQAIVSWNQWIPTAPQDAGGDVARGGATRPSPALPWLLLILAVRATTCKRRPSRWKVIVGWFTYGEGKNHASESGLLTSIAGTAGSPQCHDTHQSSRQS